MNALRPTAFDGTGYEVEDGTCFAFRVEALEYILSEYPHKLITGVFQYAVASGHARATTIRRETWHKADIVNALRTPA